MIDEMAATGPAGEDAERTRREIAREGWRWFREHEQDRILSVRLLVVTARVRVGQLRPLFVALFGEEPSGSGGLGDMRGRLMARAVMGTAALAGLVLVLGGCDSAEPADPPAAVVAARSLAPETVRVGGAAAVEGSGEQVAPGTGVLAGGKERKGKAQGAGKREKRGGSTVSEPPTSEYPPFVVELGRVDSSGNCIVGYLENGWIAVSAPSAECRRELEDIERVLLGNVPG